MNTNPDNRANGQPGQPRRQGQSIAVVLLWLAIVCVCVTPILAWFVLGDSKADKGSAATAIAQKGALTISITERGIITSQNKTTLRSMVTGRNSILQIVEEGTIIQPEDVVDPTQTYTPEQLAEKTPLVVLDEATLRDALVQQEISLENADAAFIQAQASLEVTKNQAKSDVETAELNLLLAQLDHEKYISEEGQYANELNAAESKIKVVEQELEQAKKRYTDSQMLAREGVITPIELESDRLSFEKSKISLTQARNDKELLEKFTHKRTLAELKNTEKQAESALERAKKKAEADVIQAQATLRAATLELDQRREKFNFTKSQLKYCTIYAPRTGRVVYADTDSDRHYGRDEPLGEGVEVYERQALVHISADQEMMAIVKIHEAMRTRVKVGTPAKLRSVEFPDVVFTGQVREIADSPDAASRWGNPDLRVYRTEVTIDPTEVHLRTGMSCQVEIIIDTLEEVVSVPLQCLVRIEGKPHVYVIDDKGETVPREVVVGMDNNRRVHIKSGLEPGEKVSLNPKIPVGAEGIAPTGDIPEPNRTPVNQSAPNNPGGPAASGGTDNQDTAGSPPKPENQETQTPQTPQQPGSASAGLDREKLQNMTPEQRRKAMEEYMKKLTPEQQKAMRERMQSGRNQSPDNNSQRRPRPQP